MQLEQAASGRGFALSAAGLGGLGAVHWNLGAPELYEQVLRRGEARLARDGALVAATGARMVTTMANELAKSGRRTALLGICAAGGLGAAAVLENAGS